MACQDCFKNCGDNYTSDKCVEYTGPDIPALGICTGDTLSIVEAQIFEYLIAALEGAGIVLEDVTLDNCPDLQSQFVGKDKTLVNLFQLLIDNQCSLKETLDELAPVNQVFDVKCLTGLPVNPTSSDILQAVINTVCSLKTTVDLIPATYVKISDLQTLVSQIVSSQSSTSSGIPKNVPVPYIGSLSNFDNTGKGTGDYLGWFMMNGLNGTSDWRGRKVVGSVRNVPGGTLDAEVNPSLQGSGVNYGQGDKFGKPYHTLTIDELPSHTHGVTDPGHNHAINGSNASSFTSGGYAAAVGLGSGFESAGVTNTRRADVTIDPAGNSLPHENRDPSVAAVWIVKL